MPKKKSLTVSCKDHSLIVHVAVVRNKSGLLVKYKDSSAFDGQSGWFLPNDELKHIEHPDTAAKRVLKEQVGIENAILTLSQIESFSGNDGSWHLIFDYLATPSSDEIMKGSNVSLAQWCRIKELPNAEEFAHHGWGRGVLRKLAKVE